jgi:hypothetical protein
VLNDEHTCASSGRHKTTTPTGAWVAARALPLLMKKPHMGAKELQSTLQDTFGCTITYDTVWHGKKKALKQLFGSWEESFQLLWSWRAAVMQKSPDSIIELDVKMDEARPFFSKFFCALGPCISGFKEGCRPYLSVGSTALNGRWNGHLCCAIGVDGHDWMYPVAYGFFEAETTENWTWFFQQLYKVVGDLPLLALCSDACKGLKNVMNNVFPQAEKRECFRNLMQNYVKQFAGSEHMYPAARAYRREVFDHYFSSVQEIPEVSRWLVEHHDSLWYRNGFNTAIKCDYVTNNIAEVFNNWIKDWKDLPVCELADKIREEIMELFHRRRRIGQRLQGRILPSVVHILHARTIGLGHLTVKKVDNYVAEVRDNNHVHSKHIVNVGLRQCSCNEWQHTGKPCHHALCLTTTQQFKDVRIEDFVDDYYSVEKFVKVYSRVVEPIGDKSFWPRVPFAKEVGAPIGMRGDGRQRKNKIKGCVEGGSGKKANENENVTSKKMIRGRFKCPNCGEFGHRKASYKCPFNGTKKRYVLDNPSSLLNKFVF